MGGECISAVTPAEMTVLVETCNLACMVALLASQLSYHEYLWVS